MDVLKIWDEATQTWITVPAIQGPQGPQGPAGPGVPPAGSAGDVLAKNTAADQDTGWKPLRTVIWTNPSPSSQFAAQTINNVDLSGFTWFLAEFRISTGSSGARVSVIASIGSVTAVTSNTPYQNKLRQFERDMTLNDSSIVFGNATTTTEGANTTQANTLLIPIQVIGLL